MLWKKKSDILWKINRRALLKLGIPSSNNWKEIKPFLLVLAQSWSAWSLAALMKVWGEGQAFLYYYGSCFCFVSLVSVYFSFSTFVSLVLRCLLQRLCWDKLDVPYVLPHNCNNKTIETIMKHKEKRKTQGSVYEWKVCGFGQNSHLALLVEDLRAKCFHLTRREDMKNTTSNRVLNETLRDVFSLSPPQTTVHWLQEQT